MTASRQSLLLSIIIGFGLALACGQERGKKPFGSDREAVTAPSTGDVESESQTEQADNSEPARGNFGFTCTKYPVVFHHGFLATRNIGQFRKVAEHFQEQGCKVLVTQVAALEGSVFRSVQLQEAVEDFLDEGNHPKVNIIAHSQGGLDARYAVAKLPGFADKVASVNMLSTPNQGSYLAEVFSFPKNKVLEAGTAGLLNVIGNLIDRNDKANADQALSTLSPDYMKNVFNPMAVDAPGILYQSWGARASGIQRGVGFFLTLPIKFLEKKIGPNDGIVDIESAKWGSGYQGTLDANHFELVGFGPKNGFDHLKFLDDLVSDLAAKGF